MQRYLPILIVLALAGCATTPPRSTGNLCDIFREKGGWYGHADNAFERWGAPIPVQMAIIYQESRFVADVRPPRRRLLWVIPWTHISSAYGYTQALDSTWAAYQRATGNGWADRDDFGDATDFVGWYIATSHARLGISKADAYSQYLAYHEGPAGYRRATWKRKAWLRRTAGRVDARAARYQRQLAGCKSELEHPGHWWWPF